MKKLLLFSLATLSFNLNSRNDLAVSSTKDNPLPEMVCTIICPADIVINLDPGYCDAEVSYTVTSTMCSGSIVQTSGLPSGSTFPIGTTSNCFQIQIATCCFNVTVNEYPTPTTTLACNDNVQVSVDDNCEAFIETDMILEGGPYKCYNDYIVAVQGYGSGFGGVSVNSNAVGQTLSVTVTDPETGNSCFGTISVEDKTVPIITCPPTVNSTSCGMIQPNITGFATAIDNCTNNPLITWTDDEVMDVCPGIGSGILRTWIATDESGNYAECLQQIGERCQARQITFYDITNNSISLEWINGNGDNRIVIMNTSNSFTPPINGLDYDADPSYDPPGEQVVFNGTANFVTVSNLLPNTTYWFRVYEEYCVESSPVYYLSQAIGNPNSQKTSGTNVQISNITLTNVIDLHQSIPSQHTLYSGPMASIKPLKVCADGTAATYIKANMNSTQGINFQILDELGNVVSDALNQIHSNSVIFGNLGIPTVFGSNVEVSYTAPEHMNLDGVVYRTLSVRVLKDGSPIPGSSFPLYIYRPPIVFIHGLWGKGTAFKMMEMTFSNEGVQNYDLMFRMDYSAKRGASKTFKYNNYVLPNSIDEAFRRMRLKNYSASKVDIIAHSMGGILSRIYLQKNLGSNGYRSDINKLITIDSPFGGTQSANCLLNSYNFGLRKFLALPPLFKYCKEGAVRDLRANSEEIENLQNNHFNHHSVAIYPIRSTVPFDHANYDDGSGDKSLIYLVYWYNPFIYNIGGINSPEELTEYIYFNESGDLVVPSSSQTGNSLIYNNTPFTAVHTESKDNADVIAFIKTKLSRNPYNPIEFNKSGFGYLDELDIRNDNIVPDDGALTIDTVEQNITITSPLANDHFSPGDSISISIEGTEGVERIIGTALTLESGLIVEHSESNLINFKTKIPDLYVGPIWIYGIGYDANNRLYIDSVKIESTTNSIIDSISIYPKPIFIGEGLAKSIEIMAYYSNGLIKNIGYDASLISNVTDLNIATYIGNTEIEGIALGETELIVNYQGHIDSTQVIVYPFEVSDVASIEIKSNYLCSGKSIEFISASTGQPDSIVWYFDGGIPSTSKDRFPTVSYVDSGDFDVQLIAFYPQYSDTMNLQDYMHVLALPEAIITGNNSFTFCKGDSIQLSSSSESSFSWNTGESTQSIIVDSAGLYFVAITDSLGCSNVSDTIEITIWNPQTEISNEGDSILCIGESTELSASDAISYLWNTGETTQSIVVAKAGVYGVTITDQNGCIASAIPFEVIESDSLIAEISSESNNFCLGDSVLLTSSEASSYIWNTGETSNSITVYSPGEYIVTLSDQNGCSSVSSPVEISVYDLPSVNLGADITVNSDSFILDAGPNFTKYEWSTNDTTQIIVIATPGEYSITITDSNGCHASDTIKVDFITGTSFLNALQGIHVYPNPNRGFFHIENSLSTPEELSYEIYDYLGRLVVTDLIESTPGKVNTIVSIPNASSGIYYLRLRLGSNSDVIKLAVL